MYIDLPIIFVIRDFHNEKEKSLIGFMFICFFYFFTFLYERGSILQRFCHGRKNIKYTDSYDVIDLSICYDQ